MVEFEVPEIDYDRYSNRELAVVPLVVLAVAIAILVGSWLLTGSPVALGIDFTGGSELTVETSMSQSAIESSFETEPESIQGVQASDDTYVITFGADAGGASDLADQAGSAGMTVEGSGETPASFGSESQRLALIGLTIAFVGMSLLAFLLFRTFVPSIAIVISAFSDIMIPLAIVSLLRIEVTLGTVAALLMLIGYSVDSDILLNNHILRRRGDFYESTYNAMRTGVSMTLTSIAAMAVMALMATYYGITLMSQIGLVLFLGLSADLMNTYMLNLSLLRWYKFEGVNR